MKRVLVTGANGQLGSSLRRLAGQHAGYSFLFTDVDTLDLCQKQAVADYVQEKKVDYIINCAAYTAVDKAEDDPDLCEQINKEAVVHLAEAAKAVGAKVIHVSTDYVFNGRACVPYKETDDVDPVSVYGYTKLAGEVFLRTICRDAVIVRTAWLYSEYGNNFLKTILRLGSERPEIRVVFDQVGSPTYAGDLAEALLTILEQGANQPGTYHYSNEGVCSWYDFTVKIMELAGLPAQIIPIESKDYPARATRPHYSVLNKAKIKADYQVRVPYWEASLRQCLENMNVIKK